MEVPHAAQSLGLFAIFHGVSWELNSPRISVVVAGAVRSAARLVVVLFVVVRAHVKGGEQTACRHNLIFAHLWCVFEHTKQLVTTSNVHPPKDPLFPNHLQQPAPAVCDITALVDKPIITSIQIITMTLSIYQFSLPMNSLV